MKKYEAIDISGDAGIRAFGRSPGELFVNAALGMYSLIVDAETVLATGHIEVTVRHASLDGLLVAWLNELIFRFDVHGFLARDIVVIAFSSTKKADAEDREYLLAASLSGESFDPERHQGKLLVKAATYHNLKVEHRDGDWTAEVIFDI
ncbi:MAG: archease [Nitrospiraceae bacterium]|nr:archease [Nitrospiraceae bacterium]